MHHLRGISYWRTDRREQALDEMASLRSRSPQDHRAFPEEMETAYAKRQRGRRADALRGTGQDSEAPATEVFPGFCVRLIGDASTQVGPSFTITHESGASRSGPLEKDTFVAFSGLAPEAGGTWLLSLNRYDYQGVDAQPAHWPVREELVLKASDGDSPDITVEVESLQYTYEPGLEGPLIAYPARSEDGGESTA